MVPWFQNCGKKIECIKHEKKVLKKLNKSNQNLKKKCNDISYVYI